jgi:hypothetical protein
MPTNLLIWNIQNFTSRRITPGEAGYEAMLDINGQHIRTIDYNLLRQNYILNNIAAAAAHIVVVIETISGQGVKGSLIETGGSSGCRSLLGLIRQTTNNANWYLVPPLKLVDKLQVQQMKAEDEREDILMIAKDGAYTEGVSVFYDSNHVTFIGPYVWPNSTNPNTFPNNDPRKIAVTPGVPTEAYPAPWTNVLPAGNHYAGMFEYFDGNGSELWFDGIDSRRPFFTKFTENGTGRIISLVSVHLPPKGPSAGVALTKVAGFFRFRYPIAQNEAIFIVGDYNVDYLAEEGVNYLRDLDAQYGFVPIFTRAQTRSPSLYKRRGYATAEEYFSPKGLDNLAARYGSRAAANQVQFRFLDRVSPPGALMYFPLSEIKKIQNQDQQNTCFRLPQNFGFLGPVPGTSDHLGIAYTV